MCGGRISLLVMSLRDFHAVKGAKCDVSIDQCLLARCRFSVEGSVRVVAVTVIFGICNFGLFVCFHIMLFYPVR